MNIKDYKEKEMNMYILGIIFIYIFLSNSLKLNNEEIIYYNKLISTAFASAIIYLFVFLSDAVVSSYFKDKIVYVFGIFKKPGEWIFTNIKNNCKDDRINSEKANKKYKDIYLNMPKDKNKRKKYENSEWYDIYSNYRNEKMIEISNREYLMTRDFVFVTISMFVIYIALCLLKILYWNCTFIIVLTILFIINIFSANIKAKRFVYNVIALDLTKISK